jgi:DNA-binding transcriptional LysR family regulator
MTQPAVSFQIKQLEDELRTRLIERGGKDCVLTPAGEVVRDYAERIVGLHLEMKQRVSSGASDAQK